MTRSGLSVALAVLAFVSTEALVRKHSLGAKSAAPPPCCAYGGAGAMFAMGDGSFPVPAVPGATDGRPVLVPLAIAVSGPGAASWVTVLVDPTSGPSDALAGWLITENSTAQTMYVFSNIPGQGPQCKASSVAPPNAYVAGFSMCTGGASALFSQYQRSWPISSLVANMYNQDNLNTSALTITGATQGCEPISFMGLDSPFNTGAWIINIEEGQAAAPGWGKPPAYCKV